MRSRRLDVEDLAGDEPSAFQVEHRIDDVGDFTHVADRMKRSQEVVDLFGVHRRLDDPRRDSVHADAARRIFDRKALGRRSDPALGQRCENRGYF